MAQARRGSPDTSAERGHARTNEGHLGGDLHAVYSLSAQVRAEETRRHLELARAKFLEQMQRRQIDGAVAQKHGHTGALHPLQTGSRPCHMHWSPPGSRVVAPAAHATELALELFPEEVVPLPGERGVVRGEGKR